MSRIALAFVISVVVAGCKNAPETNPDEVDASAAGACKTDGDCRLVDDYCTGCDCRALSKSAPDPTCAGPGVRCLRAPCQGQTAACVAGRCTVSHTLVRDN